LDLTRKKTKIHLGNGDILDIRTWLFSAEMSVVGCWLFFFFGLLIVQSSSSMLVFCDL
jgi:hypothetical protein